MTEGNVSSRLVNKMRNLGRGYYDKIEYATVITAPPDIRIRIDNMAIDLDADDLVIPDHLLEHERTATINGGDPVTITFESVLQPGTRVIVSSMNNGQKYAIVAAIGGGQ